MHSSDFVNNFRGPPPDNILDRRAERIRAEFLIYLDEQAYITRRLREFEELNQALPPAVPISSDPNHSSNWYLTPSGPIHGHWVAFYNPETRRWGNRWQQIA